MKDDQKPRPMKPPAQPGHLAGGHPVLARPEDELSLKARKLGVQLRRGSRGKKGQPQRLSPDLNWVRK